jgi:hypothetical protein
MVLLFFKEFQVVHGKCEMEYSNVFQEYHNCSELHFPVEGTEFSFVDM